MSKMASSLRDLCTKHVFRYGGVKNSLKMLIYSCKLRFFDAFCLALTKNLRRAKVSLNGFVAAA